MDGVLKSEFGFGLGKPGVKILDPFAGTGTFIVRAIESGLIKSEDLPHKYRNDLHANEIVPAGLLHCRYQYRKCVLRTL